jgi:hypothetical protein
MKAWAVIGALMSFLAAAPADERERPREPAGHAVEGQAFYVWDEDREEAEDWARELAESWARAIAANPTDRDDA